MCTLVILLRPDHPWPLMLGANRDEMLERPSAAPGRHWADRPEVVAGLDRLAGGSWLGVNDHGVVAAVMNRQGTLGPDARKRSRGELVLEALDHAEASAATEALAEIDPQAYRPFNLFVGDPQSGYWIAHRGAAMALQKLSPGLHMLTSGDLDDPAEARIRSFLPRFRAAPVPDPETGEWESWKALLTSRTEPPDAPPGSAMYLETKAGFGTVSSSLLALPRYPGFSATPVWLHAERAAPTAEFVPLSLSEPTAGGRPQASTEEAP